MSALPVEIGLTAAIVALAEPTGEAPEPTILVARGGPESMLPTGSFDPLVHRTLEMGLRDWVTQQAGTRLGYVEQLYTFGDRGRHARAGDVAPHVVSIGYLALALPPEADQAHTSPAFRSWYEFFPWEDFRRGRPALLDAAILPALDAWARTAPGARRERVALLFGLDGARFDEENVLERFELLYEAAMVDEAVRDGRHVQTTVAATLGRPMRFDHRRILATAMGRLRAKLKYRPVVFELLPEAFTLTHLQHAVEAISGRPLHKQNFRRLVDATEVLEPTGATSHATGGRPAALFRFRREIVRAPGLRVGRA